MHFTQICACMCLWSDVLHNLLTIKKANISCELVSFFSSFWYAHDNTSNTCFEYLNLLIVRPFPIETSITDLSDIIDFKSTDLSKVSFKYTNKIENRIGLINYCADEQIRCEMYQSTRDADK